MKSPFHHPFPEQETDEAILSKEENTEDGALEAPEGLIPASDLPSAADALEDLFREDAPPQSSVGAPTPEVPKPTIRELLLEEEEFSLGDAATETVRKIEPAAEVAAVTDILAETETARTTATAVPTQLEIMRESGKLADGDIPTAVDVPAAITVPETSQEPVVDLAELIHGDEAGDLESERDSAINRSGSADKQAPVVSPPAGSCVAHESTQAIEPAHAVEAPLEAESPLDATRPLEGEAPLEAKPSLELRTPSDTDGATDVGRAPEIRVATEAVLENVPGTEKLPHAKLATDLVATPGPELLAEAQPVAVGTAQIPLASSDWALEEHLACHKEWVESRGTAGSKANFAGAELEGAELIGINLRFADAQDANLKGADLLLADLRDSCLVRTNLQESCLVGANLEGANLEGATLDTAMGLVPRQLAGANLHEASLPEQIAEFEAQREFARASDLAARFFTATMAISAISGLLIWMTKDLQLLSDSCIIPFLHSPAAAAALPTAQIYLIAPVVLFIVYCVFHFHLQNLWDAVLQLPGVFPNGRELGQDGPRIVSGLLRAHFRWMNRDAASTRTVERAVALLLAYWVAPLTLLLFWARYLTLQDLHGTVLHLVLVVVASGVALYSTTKVGRPQETWPLETKPKLHWLSKVRDVNPLKASAGFGAFLLLLAIGTTKGAPHDKSRAPQFSEASIRRWAPTFFWYLGYEPYANLTEASISTRPANWTGADDQIPSVKGAKLMNTSFRYAQAYGVFLVNARLWQSNFQGAFLADADLRGSDLGQGTLRYAIMDRARLYRANLDRGNLDGANLDRADFREANLSHCSLIGAVLVDAQLQGASLYAARLTGSSMERANLERSDLRSAYLDNTNLDHADLQQGYFWSAKLSGANLRNSQLASAIFIDADLQNSDLRGSQLSGTVLNGTNLTGATIDGVDLRAALGLTVSQICSTKSRSGAILLDSLAAQVQAACGGPLLAAPTAVVPPASAAAPAGPSPVKKSAAPQAPVRVVSGSSGEAQSQVVSAPASSSAKKSTAAQGVAVAGKSSDREPQSPTASKKTPQ